ncbi:MAG: nucleotidyltransferase family protein [Lachnospiraceae bacterium]|nr:nucleotidyltransferase family protein [Lachnospiraceae bacterium]
MKTVGLITEYNPFHKGHEYHIKEAKRQTGADLAVIVMSGNYVQRGMPAFLDKYSRTEIALKHGADLVIELPLIFAVGSAEIFAQGAVSILDRIGVTDFLCFGTEETEMEKLLKTAQILASEPEKFQDTLKENLKKGLSFPAARARALCIFAGSDKDFTEDIINQPNNILAVEYLKTLIRRNSNIIPLCIPRIHSGYYDSSFEHRFFSASALRSLENPDILLSALKEIDSVYTKQFHISCPVQTEDFDTILGQRLLSACASGLTIFSDISHDIENAIRKNLFYYTGFHDFAMLLKNKSLTYTRICRCLLHIMLNIRADIVRNALIQDLPGYIRILGFTKKGSELLSHIRSDIIPLIRTAGYQKVLTNPVDREIFEINLHADELYRMTVMTKFKQNLPNEFNKKLLVL